MSTIKCPRCDYTNSAGVTHCTKCGYPLPTVRAQAEGETKKEVHKQKPIKTPNVQGTLHRGETFAGRYTVVKLIGRGGMGSIYKVFDNTLKEEVALKLLLPQFAKDPMIVERFLNEARIARKLSHPNIIRVHDIGISGNILYISMEYIEGKSLRGILEGLVPGQRLPLRQVLHYFDQLCSALEYAHQFTVHRDIKPENVMVTSQEVVKLMDFGISKLMADTRLTGVSVVMGTPFYMSPEQIRNSRDVDARSDIYSCGILLYELLTGQIPTGIPKPASELVKELPPELDKIVEKCIQPEPRDRFQSATELRQALRPLKELLQKDDTSVHPVTKRGQLSIGWKRLFNRRVVGWSLIGLSLIAYSGGLLIAEQYRLNTLNSSIQHIDQEIALFEQMPVTKETYIRLLLRLEEKAKERAQFDAEAQLYLNYASPYLNQIKQSFANKTYPQDEVIFSCARYLSAIFTPHEGMVLIPDGTVTYQQQTYFVPAFFVDVTEVTRDQFQKFCSAIPGGWDIPPLSGYESGIDTIGSSPVTMVNYFDALAYASYMQKSLPTIHQWLRSAQGDTNRPYPWGDVWKPDSANLGGVQNTIAPIKTYKDDLTPTGCYDMLGNVAEWTKTPAIPDCAETNLACPRIIMGGDFASTPTTLTQERSADPDVRSPQIGFRCVKDIPISPEMLYKYLRP